MTYSHKFYILLTAFFLMLNTSAFANSLNPDDVYFFKMKSSAKDETPKGYANLRCVSVSQGLPQYKNMDEFAKANSCKTIEEDQRHIEFGCQVPGSTPDFYYFGSKIYCEQALDTFIKMNNPETIKTLMESENEPWSMVQYTSDANKNFTISECQASSYKNPDDISQGGRCHAGYANEAYKSYFCDSAGGQELAYSFVRGKKMCETMRPILIDHLKQSGGKQISQ